jgi:branched-chain amino acid transport system substrate-binding protein
MLIRVFILVLWCVIFSITSYAQVNNRENVLRNSDIIENVSKQTIKLAIVLPLTGDNGRTGERLKKSIPIIERLNESFKYDKQFGLNFKLKVDIFDDACDIQKAQNIAQDIIKKGDFLFIIGHFCSATSKIVAPLYEEAGIIQITPFSTEPSLTEQGYKTFFRLSGRNDRYGEVAADWLHEFRNRYKLATIYDDNIYGKSLVDNVVTGLKLRSDAKSKNQDDYYTAPINLSDYNNNIPKLVDRLIYDNVKMVYYGGYYLNLIKIIAEVKRRQKKMVV